ncbi:GAF domain-containing protein [Sphingomonas baiyangensis]|uniref:histidine kinase n=2 Tax=Sphingomonas baiyangensis TaxID=2572576 RepID=A0A4V6WRG8_9SPHN|nr:GAF domain-containing protein [Sphingomonas baiyangensis]
MIAAHVCAVPIALVSLLDLDRQWFKAHHGIEVRETSIEQSVCRLEIEHPALLEIEDLTADPRTCDNPLVTGERAFRFYAGAPLILRDGNVVGRLCMIDTVARPGGLDAEQRRLLEALARQVSDHLELHRLARQSERRAALQAALAGLDAQLQAVGDFDAMTKSAIAVAAAPLGLEGEHGGWDAFAAVARPHAERRDEQWFVQSVGDRLAAAIARRRADELQAMLNGEIGHRLKNMLSMVQSIATQTLRGVPDRAPVIEFERRLMALSAAHGALFERDWQPAGLDAVAHAVLGVWGFGERIALGGPAVVLGARAALTFSLVLHEMMTNAVKYGALSNDNGRVAVTWRVDDGRLVLAWRETGGPCVRPPARRGFGSRLIGLGLIGEGGVAIRYPVHGVEAEFETAIDRLTEA